MNTYPKALYAGTKKKRKLASAKNAEHERQLRSQGYVDYADLPDDAPNTQNGGGSECAELQQKWNDRQALMHRYQELTGHGVPVLEPAEPPPHTDYNSWTVKQLQAELNKRGVSFSSSTNKAELVEMLTQLAGEPVIILE